MDSDVMAILNATHAALLDGDLDAIGPLAVRLDAALGSLSTSSADTLGRVRAQAQRNARMLQAAEQGVRAARRRLSELQEAASGHRTYGRDGQRAAMAALTGQLRQRV